MKRRVSIIVDVELDATRPSDIQLAADDALSQIAINSMIDAGDGHYRSATLVDKGFMLQDGQVLLDLVLKATGVDEEQFLNGRHYQATQARYVFTHFANRYLAWSYSQIGRYIKKSKYAIAKAAQNMANQKYVRRTGTIVEAMTKIQAAWSRIKE